MKAEIKTVTTEVINLELTIQEAHYLRALIGRSDETEAKPFGLPEGDSYRLYTGLSNLLGPQTQFIGQGDQ